MPVNPSARAALVTLAGLGTAPCLAVAIPDLGPGVVAEPLPAGLRINGVAVQVTRLQGPGLPAYIAGLQSHWQAQGTVRQLGPWRLVSRQQGAVSEVIQWRSTLTGTEALWSRLDLRLPTGTGIGLSLRLPAACRVVSQLELGGRQSPVRQLTARCGLRADTLSAWLHRAAIAAGWENQNKPGARTLQLQRGPLRLRLSVIEQPEPASRADSVLVAIESRAGAAP